MRIRRSVPADVDDISTLHVRAFGCDEGPVIANLVRDLFDDPGALPLYSFVAADETEITGHILFSRVWIDGPGENYRAQILAPLAVAPKHQGTGVGSRLIGFGLDELKKAGTELVFVLGHPGYYPRTGFVPALPLGLAAPHRIPAEHADAWMVQFLRGGLAGEVKGCVRCCEALDDPRHWTE
jgi:predicted N-acetyltransferase YhbS